MRQPKEGERGAKIMESSDEGNEVRRVLAQALERGRGVGEKVKVSVIETRADRAAGEGVGTERASGLPAIGRNGVGGACLGSHRPEPYPVEIVPVSRGDEQLEWPALVEVPDLVGSDAVP